MVWKVSVFKEWRRKISTIKRLESEICNRKLVEEAKSDWHSRRRPRPCGLTVHTGIGCDYACSYCYIPDMGFPFKSKPYHLTGLQIAYSIALNPYVALGLNGTFLAYGSITEPFLKSTVYKTYEYLEAAARHLGNPMQISTKAYLTYNDVLKLKRLVNGKLSVLVTIITLKHYSKLEEKAPNPELRFQTLYNFKRAGFNPVLFLRPIIPGINDYEVKDILEKAISYGINRVLIGSLRVTFRIMSKLKALNMPLREVEKRILRKPKTFSEQVPVRTADIKEKIAKLCEKLDVKVYYQACQVCAEDFNIPCCLPCSTKYGCCREYINYDVDEVRVFLETVGKGKIRKIVDGKYVLNIKGNIKREFTSFLRWVLKKKIVVK